MMIRQTLRRGLTTRASCELYPGVPHTLGRAHPTEDLVLDSGKVISKSALHIEYSTWGDPKHPTILLFPSMSNSASPMDSPLDVRARGAGELMGES